MLVRISMVVMTLVHWFVHPTVTIWTFLKKITYIFFKNIDTKIDFLKKSLLVYGLEGEDSLYAFESHDDNNG